MENATEICSFITVLEINPLINLSFELKTNKLVSIRFNF